jgi:hypothetical protein
VQKVDEMIEDAIANQEEKMEIGSDVCCCHDTSAKTVTKRLRSSRNLTGEDCASTKLKVKLISRT